MRSNVSYDHSTIPSVKARALEARQPCQAFIQKCLFRVERAFFTVPQGISPMARVYLARSHLLLIWLAVTFSPLLGLFWDKKYSTMYHFWAPLCLVCRDRAAVKCQTKIMIAGAIHM